MPNKQKSPPGTFANLMGSKPEGSVLTSPPTPTDQMKKSKGKAKKNTYMHVSKHTNMHAYMQSIIEKKATNTFAFRYPPELLDKLEDAIYLVWKKSKTKLTKNSVAVSGVAYLLWDFEENGKNSILYKILVKDAK